MKFASITMENFKSYRDRKTLEFSTDDKKYITVLEGQMGHGKSNLLNAFYWCLFDQFWHSDEARLIANPDPNEVDLFNHGSLSDNKKAGANVELSVEIEFWDDDENIYTVKRILTGHYIKNKWKHEHTSTLTLKRIDSEDGTSKTYEGRDAEAEIERFFPKSLSNYFLFRGENRAQLVKLQGKEEFQKALAELSKIEVFRRSVRHLSSALDIYQKEAANLASSHIKSDMEAALKDKENAEKVISEYQSELSKLEELLNKALAEYADASSLIKENEKALKHQGEKEALEKDEKDLAGKHDIIIQDRDKDLARYWSALIAKPVIEKIEKRYGEAVESGTYPPNIHPSVIDKILEEFRCICGRDFDKDSVEQKLIEALKSQDSYDQVIRDVEALMNETKRASLLVTDMPGNIQKYEQQANEIREEIKEKRKQIELLRKQIGQIDVSLEELLERQSNAKDDEVRTKTKIKEVNELINDKKREIKEIEKRLDEYRNKMDKSQLPVIKLDLAQKSLIEAENLKSKFEKTIYDELEKYTQKHWDIMVYDKLNYSKILLDRNEMYFDVIDNEGHSRRGSMNTGHSILLVLSFISALIRIAKETWEEEFPLVLDAPLSEIGETAMPSAMNGFGKVFNQAIIILKDGSVSDGVENQIKSKLGKRYWIEFDKQRQHSNIKEQKI